MTFEQPASLNRCVDPWVQSRRSFRWNLFKLLLPFLVLIPVFIFQTILLQDWERDHWELAPFLVVPGLLVFMFFSFEVQWRMNAKRKKFLKLGENGIRTGYGLAHRARWQQILGWQFNNIANERNYRVVTVGYRWGYQGKKLRRHTIVLEKSQVDQLILEVKLHQQKNNLAFSVVNEEASFIPKPLEIKNNSMAKACVDAAGVLLLMEGVLFFMASFGLEDDSPDPDAAPNPHGSFAKFMRAHFSSGAEFRHFLLVTGTILCGSGLVLMIWSRLVMTERTQPMDFH